MKKESNDKWLDTVVEKVNGTNLAPPEGSWNKILSGVAARRRRRRMSAWITAGAIAAAAAVTPVAILSIREGSTENLIPDTGIAAVARNEMPARLGEAEPAGMSAPQPIVKAKTAAKSSVRTDRMEMEPEREDLPVGNPEEKGTAALQQEPENISATPSVMTEEPEVSGLERYLASLADEDEISGRGRKVSFSLSGDLALSHTTTDIWNRELIRGTSVSHGGYYGLAMNAASSSIKPVPRKAVSAFQYRHHQPLSVKLAISYPIADRWALESGVQYTYLCSDITSKNASTGNLGSQHIHFLGIPVNLRYTFLDSGRSSLYATAGGAAEKCVKASANGSALKIKPWFWSGGAGGGYQLEIIKGMGLFAEAGCTWHFRNEAVSYTPFDDNPLQFSLQAGIRIF